MDALSYYEILLPCYRNGENQVPYRQGQKDAFEYFLLQTIGGFTVLPICNGQWKNSYGRVFDDTMRPYHVLCTGEQKGALIDKAFELYDDQEAIFCARIGEGWIYSRADLAPTAEAAEIETMELEPTIRALLRREAAE